MKDKKTMCSVIALACSASVVLAAGPAVIDFENIPVGTSLDSGQYGWYHWGTGGSGQTVVLSDAGNHASEGPGSSSFVSTGPDSIHSMFIASDAVLMEWDVELRGFGPSNDRGPTVHFGRDLDNDGILEFNDVSPADAGYEGLVGIQINYDRVRIRYFTLNELGVRHQDSTVLEWIYFSTAETDLHCSVLIENTSSHEMELTLTVSGASGEIVQQVVPLEFNGPHRWDEINGTVMRTDNAGSKIDNIKFSVSCSPSLADLDGNGQLDFFDISGFLLFYQLQDPIVDFTSDGNIDFFDVSAFLRAYTTGCP